MFKQIESLLDNMDLTFTIAKKDDKISVSVLPRPKKTSAVIPPFVAIGTAEELDQNLISKLLAPLNNVSGFILDTSAAEEAMKAKKAEEEKKKKETAEKKGTKKVIGAPIKPKPNDEEDEDDNDSEDEKEIAEIEKIEKENTPPNQINIFSIAEISEDKQDVIKEELARKWNLGTNNQETDGNKTDAPSI